MRIQLPPMIDDSVEFVQRKYQDDFDHNREDSKKVWKWFHENRAFFEAIAAYVDWDWPYGEGITYDDHDVTSPDEDYLTRYIEIVLEEVVKSNKPLHELPKPFELDITRIGHIRESVTRLETEQCQVTVLNIMISQRKGATQPSSESEQHLIRRLKDINSFSEERSEGLEMAAIEIVRMAYTYAPESKSIPDPLDVCQARDMLDIQTRAGLRVATMVRETIHELISQQVFEEINGSNGICDLWPAQILKRYGSFFQTNSELDLIDSAEKVASEIRHISQQVARIALIQWRIWAQLLWFKPQAAIFATTQEYMAWQSEARIRVNERLSQHRYSSSEAYAESTIRNTDMHSSHIVKTSLPRTSDPRFSSNIMLSEHQDHSDSRYNGAVVQMT